MPAAPSAASVLPVRELEPRIVAALRAGNRLVLQAPTGSGKSTQVPQMLLDQGLLGAAGRVVVLQPRRLATRVLAARVASERGQARPGGEVGYRIRLESVVSRETRIEFVTEGVLLRQLLADPELRGVGAVVFDEFHERHLSGDVTLARALQVQESTRPDLRLVVMSATLETAALETYLAPCASLVATGRTYPVATDYLPAPLPERTPVWEAAADELTRLADRHPEGDALVFMPGAYEINRTLAAIRAARGLGREWVALPLHGDLPPADQDAALARPGPGRRKVVVATNVAETSLTIDGVRLVVDAGLARVARYDPYRGINTLLVEKVSRAAADQRAGRAGRTAPGWCQRLWTAAEHALRPAQETPEVRRLDLAEVVLTLKAAGVDDVPAFRWLEPPERRALDRASQVLADLGALERVGGAITPLGRELLAFPVHPRYARMLWEARALGCVDEVSLVAALTQGRGLWLRQEAAATEEARDRALGAQEQSDLLAAIRAYRFAVEHRFDPARCRSLGISAAAARQTSALHRQFRRLARDGAEPRGDDDSGPGSGGPDLPDLPAPAPAPAAATALRRCVLTGFSDQLARRLDAGTLRCALVGGRRGVLARESVVRAAPLFVAGEVREVQGRGDELTVLLSQATAVDEEWLRQCFPDDFRQTEEVFYDDGARRVRVRRSRWFRDLALAEALADDVPREAAATLLAGEVLAGRCPLKNWDDAVEQWIARANALAGWMPELALPAVGPAERRALVEQICDGALGYKEIKERAVWPVVRSWLSNQQQAWLDQYAPERIELPNGRRAKLRYPEAAGEAPGGGGPPVLAARIQDLYGVGEGFRVAAGRVAVTIQVLAPNHRPVQVTQNLATFWRESYPKIRPELQRKYPKHEWR